ncbi:single-stranded DNA-binding protein [Kribbella sp. CA-293567]|uniref:single-stranded DNA-binding protein n=1 Tax=Kribbella sp. CA-293567 TaxID=3002436 RepID=UPI0022DE7355|nr:single-stranded DNA-binding protein [Kribbella sp. CA-293567]WBQ03338.1 single-stranded DNA-binding protein [Kribbella sp. CA-293567]
MSETYLAVQGWVGSDVRFKEVSDGVSVASFRLAATPRQYSADQAGWTDRPTNWFTVECWRALATNVQRSMVRGQPVLVTGRFRTTEWKDDAGNLRSRMVIEATSVGHDLSLGVATFTRSPGRGQFDAPGGVVEDDLAGAGAGAGAGEEASLRRVA